MDPQIINQAATTASQVGLLTWLVIAITLFCGFLTCYVLYQSGKREDRYARLVETHISGLEEKIDDYGKKVEETLGTIAEANRMVKQEHTAMITSLQKMTETMIEFGFILKAKPTMHSQQ